MLQLSDDDRAMLNGDRGPAPRLAMSILVRMADVYGARTERYPDLLDVCCAITGRVPAVGLHLTAQRAGQMLLRLAGVAPALQQDDQFFAVLGHLVGTLAGDQIPVIDGILVRPAE